MSCRCGYPAGLLDDPHPCHGHGYTCGKPAQHRLYSARLVGLGGMQTKFSMSETWACDDCRREYAPMVRVKEKNR